MGKRMLEEIKEFIKQLAETNQELRILKMIDKEVDKYNVLRARLYEQAELIDDFIKLYNQIYDGDLSIEEEEE